MSVQDNKLYKWYINHQKHIQIIEGIFIIILLLGLNFMFFNDIKIKEQINKNCGWEEQDYECYCEKSKAIEIKNKLLGEYNLENLVENVSFLG